MVHDENDLDPLRQGANLSGLFIISRAYEILNTTSSKRRV